MFKGIDQPKKYTSICMKNVEKKFEIQRKLLSASSLLSYFCIIFLDDWWFLVVAIFMFVRKNSCSRTLKKKYVNLLMVSILIQCLVNLENESKGSILRRATLLRLLVKRVFVISCFARFHPLLEMLKVAQSRTE